MSADSAAETSATETPATLAARAAAGDRPALSDLYRTAGPRLYALALAVAGDKPGAETALAAAFVEIGSGLAPRDDTWPWLVDRVRSRALSGRTDGPRPAIEPARAIERADGLGEALAQLSEIQRRALVMAYASGASMSELASQLGLPEVAAEANLRRALLRLRRALGR